MYEKYVGLARDATSAGDRVAAETYYQHAEHYFRIVNARTDPNPEGEGQSGRRGDGNGQAEVVGEAAPRDPGEQPRSAALNGEQPPAQPAPEAAPQAPQVAPPAEDRPAPQKRRRPRQAKPAAPQPDKQPDTQPETPAAAQPGDDGEPVEA